MEEVTWSPQHASLEVSSPVCSEVRRAGQGITRRWVRSVLEAEACNF